MPPPSCLCLHHIQARHSHQDAEQRLKLEVDELKQQVAELQRSSVTSAQSSSSSSSSATSGGRGGGNDEGRSLSSSSFSATGGSSSKHELLANLSEYDQLRRATEVFQRELGSVDRFSLARTTSDSFSSSVARAEVGGGGEAVSEEEHDDDDGGAAFYQHLAQRHDDDDDDADGDDVANRQGEEGAEYSRMVAANEAFQAELGKMGSGDRSADNDDHSEARSEEEGSSGGEGNRLVYL